MSDGTGDSTRGNLAYVASRRNAFSTKFCRLPPSAPPRNTTPRNASATSGLSCPSGMMSPHPNQADVQD